MGMLSRQILDLLQAQFKHETANHLRYVARASWARYRGFEGAGDFFEKEADGELAHAKVVREYIEARNEVVRPEGLSFTETSEFGSFDVLFTSALVVEQGTTDKLSEIFQQALTIGDVMTVQWVQGLISEQVEEESLYQTIIDRMVQRGGGGDQVSALARFKDDPAAAHDIDVWLAERMEA